MREPRGFFRCDCCRSVNVALRLWGSSCGVLRCVVERWALGPLAIHGLTGPY